MSAFAWAAQTPAGAASTPDGSALPRPPRRDGDGPMVPVLDGDLEGALRELRKRYDRAGLRTSLRRHHAAWSRGERRRYKHARALQMARRQATRAARAAARQQRPRR